MHYLKMYFFLLILSIVITSCIDNRETPWVKYEANPVIGNSDTGTCFDANVLVGDSMRYNMYFSWRPRKSVALTRSNDGIQWTEFTEVLKFDSTSGWEDNLNRTSTVFHDGKYHMWYTGQANDSSKIGYAISDDGINFTRVVKNPVIVPELNEGPSVMCPFVIWDEDKQIYRIWYSAGETYEPNMICYAESKDGITWEKSSLNPVFVHGESGKWDQERVGGCEVHMIGGKYVMFYIGYSDINTARVGCAVSDDGITGWKRYKANPIVEPSAGTWDDCACYKPTIAVDNENNRILLWYNGRNQSNEFIGLVTHEGMYLGETE